MNIPSQPTAVPVSSNPRGSLRAECALPEANAWLARLIGLQILLLAFAIAGSLSRARNTRVAPAAAAAGEVPVIDFPIEQVGAEATASENTGPEDDTPEAPAEPVVPELVETATVDNPAADLPIPNLVEALPAPPTERATPAPEVPVERSRPVARPSTRSPTGSPGDGTGTPSAPALFGGAGTGRFPLPPYPSEARRRGLEGNVVLLVEVSKEGQAGVPRIESSSGHASLDRAAVDWIRRRWRWEPGPPRHFRIPIRYQLQ